MRLILILLGVVLITGPALAEPVAKRGLAGPTARPSPTMRKNPNPAALIEARAAQEAEQQALRNTRFDTRVRRATGSICLGCVAPDAGRAGRR